MDEIEKAVEGHTVPTRFLENVAQNGNLVALRQRLADASYRELTYNDYADQVARCVSGLRALGFGPGQRLMIMLRNRPEFHVLDLAACFCGGTPVSVYNSSSPSQIEYLANHCEATIAVAEDADFLQRFVDARPQLPKLRQVGVVEPAGVSDAEVFTWSSLLNHPPADLQEAAKLAKPDDLATLIYTSGTTGDPKAVMLTHHNVVWTAESTRLAICGHPRFKDGFAGVRMVSYLPMAHIAERNVSHYQPAMLGEEVTCCPDPADIGTYLREVKPQIVFGVPRVWEKVHGKVQAALAADPERAQKLQEAVDAAIPLVEKIADGTATEQDQATYQFLDEVAFKNLRALIGLDEVVLPITGAAPMQRELQLWYRAIGVPISDVYGLSECSGPMTWAPLAAKPGTIGKAMPGVEVKLAQDGEILCRGGNVFGGYLNDPERTAESLDGDGWLHTGDIGQVDEAGYFRIVDRKKELIITAGGKNISPANLEAALKNIPLVAQACAIGDDRPFVSALLVLDPEVAQSWAAERKLGSASLADLARNAELVAEVEAGLPEAMGGFNNAERVKRVTVLPTDWLPDSEELTPTSKLKRRAIHAKYSAEIEAMYSATLAPPAAEVAAAEADTEKAAG